MNVLPANGVIVATAHDGHDDTLLKQQWLNAWDKSAWDTQPEGDDNVVRDHHADGVVDNAVDPVMPPQDAAADAPWLSLSEPLLANSLSDIEKAVLRAPVGLVAAQASALKAERSPVGLAAAGINAPRVPGRPDKSLSARPALLATLNARYPDVNFNLSSQPEGVVLWIRDFQGKLTTRLHEHIEQVRALLAKEGQVLASVMINGRQWSDAETVSKSPISTGVKPWQ